MTEISIFCEACKAHGLPKPVEEFRFCKRLWRFDYAWLEEKVALEVEGGVWTEGRHVRGTGYLGDMAKYNEAAILGWFVLRCTPKDIETGAIFPLLKKILCQGT
jgi:hypothetical protein